MTVLKILGGLLALAALTWSAFALNEFSGKKYQYKPFNMTNTGAMVIAVILAIISVLTIPDGRNLPEILSDAMKLSVSEEDSNTVVLLGLALLIPVVVYINLILKTNILISTYSISVQSAVALLLIIIMVAGLLLSAAKKKKRKRISNM